MLPADTQIIDALAEGNALLRAALYATLVVLAARRLHRPYLEAGPEVAQAVRGRALLVLTMGLAGVTSSLARGFGGPALLIDACSTVVVLILTLLAANALEGRKWP